jgi:Gene product 88
MKIKHARAIAGTIGYPSKMPGTSYGIPAKACKTGAKLAMIQGSTCSACYAMKGNYIYPSVAKAQATRLVGIEHEQWVQAIVTLLTAAHAKGDLPPYHRWHDSGDIQSRDHLAKICAVARATAWLKHWLPTRESKILRDFVRDGGSIPDNLVIRLSATMVDGSAPKAWHNTSTVHDNEPANGRSCPAPKQGNKCGNCRACWDRSVPNVSYHIH